MVLVGQSRAVVRHFDNHGRAVPAYVDGRGARRSMLEHVGEGLLHDPVRRAVEVAGEPQGGVHRERHADPGVGEAVHQLADLGEAGGRVLVGGRRFIAQMCEHVVKVGQRVAAGLLHRGKQIACLRRVRVDKQPGGASLDDEQVDRVADHVVELPGHPGLFLRDSLTPDRAAGTVLLLAPAGHCVADRPGGEPHEEHSYGVRRRRDGVAGEIHHAGNQDDRRPQAGVLPRGVQAQ